MNIQEIIEELAKKEIIPLNTVEYEQLGGGTTSNLYLLGKSENTRYVVKLNEPQVLESEAYFLDFYKSENLLPNLLYVDQSYNYIVYSFISGSTNNVRRNKKEILKTLVQRLINNYKTITHPVGWGWADEVTDSWQAFLLNRVIKANKILESYLEKEDLDLVLKLVNSPDRDCLNREPFLLHGDCGVHNFIFKEEQLCGVIDPTPVLGEPIYDLIYAFCSSPDDLTKETINSAASNLIINWNKSNQLLSEEVLIGLYLRLATCIRHHPNDLEAYLNAWNYWKDMIKEG
jgi:aminoglycoside phosphotransferase